MALAIKTLRNGLTSKNFKFSAKFEVAHMSKIPQLSKMMNMSLVRRIFRCCWFITWSNHRYQDSEKGPDSGGGDEHPNGGIVRHLCYQKTMGKTNGEIFFKSLIGVAMLSTEML